MEGSVKSKRDLKFIHLTTVLILFLVTSTIILSMRERHWAKATPTVTVNFTVQTIEVLSTGVQVYVYIENDDTSMPVWVQFEVLLGATIIRPRVSSIAVPAAPSITVTGKYFVDKTTLSATSGTVTVNVYDDGTNTVVASASGVFSLDIDCPHPGGGDVTNTGDTTNDVNVFDAILLSFAWGGAPGPSTTATITGPWAQPNADFNDDNTINISDAIMLSVNYGMNWTPTPP